MGAGAPPSDPRELVRASVRLKIEDARGSSYGSGTLIDARQGEALVLTCGHIFRDSQGKGRITVHLFNPQAPEQLPGRLVGYDLEHDVALVSIRPGVPLDIAPVAPKEQRIDRGDKVVTVGCNNGGPATAIGSQISSIDKFVGPPNLQVAGMPVEGRSGGGLFNAEGMVIGVCNAADPADNEGLYAGLASIHRQLDRAGLSALYANRQAPSRPRPHGAIVPVASREQAQGALARGQADAAWLAETQDGADSAEVICIVRSRGGAAAKSEVIMLDHASADFLKQLAADRRAQQARHLTSLEVPLERPVPPGAAAVQGAAGAKAAPTAKGHPIAGAAAINRMLR
jgi:hypothetical protein